MNASLGDLVTSAFVFIPLLLVLALVLGTAAAWRLSGATPRATANVSITVAVLSLAWIVLSVVLAESGILRQWTATPPPFGLFILAIAILSIVIAFSPFGARLARYLPLAALVGVQAFRLPLELAMHAMYERGVMPQQMSYSGRNFDIVTGSTAILVAALVAAGRGGRTLVALWNVMGLALVLNVVIVAILSTPAFRYFGDQRLNVWVTYSPFVLLPSVMVLAAFAGHLLIFRALRYAR